MRLLLFKKGLRRESNPGHPHPKRVFYHLTTKPSCYSVIDAAVLTIHHSHTPTHTTHHTLLPFLKRGLWRESNPRHLHPKQVFYHLTTKPSYYSCWLLMTSLFSSSYKLYIIIIFTHLYNKQGAPPGIEPGPLAPEASILPLNYEACYLITFLLLIYLSSADLYLSLPCSFLEKKGHNRIRTNDHGNCSPMLYHWAMRPPILPYISAFSCFLFPYLYLKKRLPWVSNPRPYG